MAIFIPCPKCATNLTGGLFAPCPGCGWTAPPETIEASSEASAMHLVQMIGRIQRSRLRAWMLAALSLALNLLLAATLVWVLVR